MAVLNPLVLLVLLGGAHNDALMLGLLVLGCVLAVRRHPLTGLACCALAAEVKAPALLATLFIVIANIIVDILYAYLDPRVRYS